MKIVKVTAVDWTQYSELLDVNFKFELISAIVIGLVVHEDEEQIVVSHQLFPRSQSADDVRYTTVIPKKVIKEIEVLQDDAEDDKLPKKKQTEVKVEVESFLKSTAGRKMIQEVRRGR